MIFWKRENLDQKVLKAFFLWLSGVATEKDVVLVERGEEKDFFCFEFPLRQGDLPRRISLSDGREATFIVRKSESKQKSLPENWIAIFRSPEIEILEDKNRISSVVPLRWGLNENEKRIALNIARESLEKFLASGKRLESEYFRNLPPRFHIRTDLDVALWVRGQMRGSAVVEKRTFGEGVAEAAILASRDSRFKPLAPEELEDTRIEITLMREPRLPLTREEIRNNVIYPEKGYLLRHSSAATDSYSNILKNVGMKAGSGGNEREKKGWFLPEVLNVRKFGGLENFLGDLAQEKAGLPREAGKTAKIFIFEVDDFIESEDRKDAMPLWGPVVIPSTNNELNANKRIGKFGSDSLFADEALRAAADWLCRIQENDGNIPPITNPLTGRQTQIDWPRLAFTAWALAEFGAAAEEQTYVSAGARACEYLKKYLFAPESGIRNPALTLAYFGELALSLKRREDALAAAERIAASLDTLEFAAISFAQIATFLKIVSKTDGRFSAAFGEVAEIVRRKFAESMKNRDSINFVIWAELANTFSDVDEKYSEEIAEWLKAKQLPNGAFPEAANSNFVYTRGTGKIFEVLALEPEKNREAIEKALNWLFSMQYDEENTFFVPEEIRSRILGGFRHDYFNQETWIDSAGHILIGAARLLKNRFFM